MRKSCTIFTFILHDVFPLVVETCVYCNWFPRTTNAIASHDRTKKHTQDESNQSIASIVCLSLCISISIEERHKGSLYFEVSGLLMVLVECI